MAPTQQESAAASPPSIAALDCLMARYQQADPEAPAALIGALSPALLRFFRTQDLTNREQADDLLQETWLRIHRVRHTYRPGQPVLPWVYAIARRVRVDGYRRTRRIRSHEIATEVPPRATPALCNPDLPSCVRNARRGFARSAEGSGDDVESGRAKPRRSSASHVMHGRRREAKGEPSLRAVAHLSAGGKE